MQIVETSITYPVNLENLGAALTLNRAFSSNGAGGVSRPRETPHGFTWILLINQEGTGVVMFRTYNQYNWDEDTLDLFQSFTAPLGTPLPES